MGLPLAAVACFLQGCAVTEPSAVTGQRSSYAYSWDQEQQIGKETDAQIIQEYGLYPDQQVQDYVQRVGHGVLQASDLRDEDAPDIYRESPFTFRVLDSPIVNAFALPGGYVYVTRGLLTHVQNEAQLATVLGHEIAHVAARHSARQALKAQYGQLGVVAGTILGQQILGDSGLAQGVMQAGSQAFQLLMTQYSRDDEREADRLGMDYAAGRGYAVNEAAAFFNTLDRISQKEGVHLPSWQSTHPDPGEREVTAQQAAKKYHHELAVNMVGEDELLEHLEGVVLGENPREGFVKGNTFYHPDLAFEFPIPRGWKMRNEKSAVMLAEPSGAALLTFQIAPASSAREAAQKLAGSQEIQIGDAREYRINGMNAVAVTGQGRVQQGTARLLAIFIEDNRRVANDRRDPGRRNTAAPGDAPPRTVDRAPQPAAGNSSRVYAFLGMSGAQAFNSASRVFEQVAEGFDRLDDPSILNVQPARVHIVEVDRSAPFVSFLPTSTVPGVTPEDLAILNHVQPNDMIPAGTKLKLPRVADGRSRD